MDLSNQARAMLAWMNPKATLRYAMIENEPSPEAESALDELIDAGLVQHEEEWSGAKVFSLTEKGREFDRRPPGETPEEMFKFMDEHGQFPLAVSRND